MADGGQYPWKRQVIDEHRGPAASYEGIKQSLPRTPAGQVWDQDLETKEWTLGKAKQVVTVPAGNNDNGKDNNKSKGDQLSSCPVNSIPSSLPNPPKGKRWVQVVNNSNDNNEWSLVDCDDHDGEKCATKEQQEQRQFLEHKLSPSDTFQGLCLRYKITPTELRQSNRGFSGTNLFLAPNPLKILLPLDGNISIYILENTDSASDKPSMVRRLQRVCYSKLTPSEARCYLELNEWDYKQALKNVKEDLAMEEERKETDFTETVTENTRKSFFSLFVC